MTQKNFHEYNLYMKLEPAICISLMSTSDGVKHWRPPERRKHAASQTITFIIFYLLISQYLWWVNPLGLLDNLCEEPGSAVPWLQVQSTCCCCGGETWLLTTSCRNTIIQITCFKMWPGLPGKFFFHIGASWKEERGSVVFSLAQKVQHVHRTENPGLVACQGPTQMAVM